MHFWYSVYYELTACTCFEHYLLIFRRRCTNNNRYIACVLYLLAATRVEVGHQFHFKPGSSQQTKHARNIPSVVCVAPPEDEQVVLETCRGC
jgi:hypothetical protein